MPSRRTTTPAKTGEVDKTGHRGHAMIAAHVVVIGPSGPARELTGAPNQASFRNTKIAMSSRGSSTEKLIVVERNRAAITSAG